MGRIIRTSSGQRIFICDNCTDKVENRQFHQGATRRPSKLEKEATQVLTDAGLPFIRQFRLEDSTFDFAIPRLRLLVEIDGPRGHRGATRRARDAARDAKAQAHQWTVEHVSVPDVAGKLAAMMYRRMHALGLI